MKWLLPLCVLCCTATAWAQGEPAKPAAVPAAPLIKMTRGGAEEAGGTEAELLVRALNLAERELFKRYREAQKAGVEFDMEKANPVRHYRPRLRELADAGDAAALVWCVQNCEWLPPAPAEGSDDHAAARAQLRSDLNKLLASGKPKHLTVVAQTAMGLGGSTLSEEEAVAICEKAAGAEGAPKADILAQMAGWFADMHGDDDMARVEATYARALAASPSEKTQARIHASLFALRNLRVGQKAPELEGPGLNGETVKLSDYKGRVVFLEFWGFW